MRSSTGLAEGFGFVCLIARRGNVDAGKLRAEEIPGFPRQDAN
jgi:hypothetical protein